MSKITSKFNTFCDTFNTKVEGEMHEVKGKRKLHLTISNDAGKHDVSLWKEDVLLMAEFLKGMAENLDERLAK